MLNKITADVDPPCGYPAIDIGPRRGDTNVYFIWIIGVLMVINLMCLIIYCRNKLRGRTKGYSVIKYQGESDIEMSDIKI